MVADLALLSSIFSSDSFGSEPLDGRGGRGGGGKPSITGKKIFKCSEESYEIS